MDFKCFGDLFEAIIIGNVEPNCGAREFTIDVNAGYRKQEEPLIVYAL
tara:strand:- start:1352 stop:1495 length:144 start_codon:yes stop_codon:yes gene_type:complete